MLKLLFVTGNANKAAEVRALASRWAAVEIELVSVDLAEEQAASGCAIAQSKAERALARLEAHPRWPWADGFLVEDAGLAFLALGGMPGPYIKWFLKSASLENIARCVAHDKRAYAEAHWVLYIKPEHRLRSTPAFQAGAPSPSPLGSDEACGCGGRKSVAGAEACSAGATATGPPQGDPTAGECMCNTVAQACTNPEGYAHFVGRTYGTVDQPSGPRNFGWDPIFYPSAAGGKSFAELDKHSFETHRVKVAMQCFKTIQ